MDFPNYLLYEDEDIRIEIDGMAHYYIDTIVIPHIKPPEVFLNTILPFIMNWLEKEGWNKGKKPVKFCGQAPIIQQGKYAVFSEPFSVFEPAQAALAEVGSLKGKEEEVESLVNECYEDILEEGEHFYCKILKEEIEGIRGYFIFINEKEIIMMTWGFETN